MPRPERPVDPEGGTIARFAIGLRELRRRAGNPGYRELAQRVHYSPTTLSQAAGGEVLPSLAVTLAYVRGCDGDVAEWERWLRATTTELEPDPPCGTAQPVAPGGCAPYVGLAAYGPGDAEWFHGRERIVDELVTRIAAHRFVTVLGPSGTGKSSVLRAGLLPRLTADGLVSAVVFTPGVHPLDECAAQFAHLLGRTCGLVAEDLAADPRGLHRVVGQVLVDRPSGAEVVLVVDQFEEVFTLCHDVEERSRFVAALVTAGRSADSRCRIVLGVRADFHHLCLLDAELAAVLAGGEVTVGPMTVDELRQVIVAPARRAGCMVEGSLLAALVAHVHGRVGALPLLSHALRETWRRRSGNTLTLAGFDRAGGIDGALAKTAEAVFASLTEGQQAGARRLFLRLVALGEGTPDTKRRAATAELGDDDTAILTAFSGARLIVLSEHGAEITHEALICAWPRLRSWLAGDREGQRVHRELTEATATWQEHDRDQGALLRGIRLAVVGDWARAHPDAANRDEVAFLAASIEEYERECVAVRRRARLLSQLVVLLAVLVIVTAATAIEAVRAERSATRQSNVVIALNALREAERVAGTNPLLAARISLAAYRLHPSQTTEDSLNEHTAVATATPLPDNGSAITLAPGGRYAAVGHTDIDLTTVFSIEHNGVSRIGSAPGGKFRPRFSVDGRRLLTFDRNATPFLWDMTGQVDLGTLSKLPTTAMGGVFGPEGTVVATTEARWTRIDPAQGDAETWTQGPTTLWDISGAAARRLVTLRQDTAGDAMGFAAGGRIMAVVSPGGLHAPPRVTLRDYTDPAAPTEVGYLDLPAGVAPTTATFAAADRFLYVGNAEGGVTTVDVRTPSRPARVSVVDGSGYPVDELVPSPDGTNLATIDSAGELVVWHNSGAGTPRPALQTTGHRGGLSGVTFAPDGRSVLVVVPAAASGTSSIARWRLDVRDSVQLLCERDLARMPAADWDRYFAGAVYEPPCTAEVSRRRHPGP